MVLMIEGGARVPDILLDKAMPAARKATSGIRGHDLSLIERSALPAMLWWPMRLPLSMVHRSPPRRYRIREELTCLRVPE